MGVRINGKNYDGFDGLSLSELLKNLGLVPAKIAVERNREIVPKSSYGQTIVQNGDVLEIITFIGGG